MPPDALKITTRLYPPQRRVPRMGGIRLAGTIRGNLGVSRKPMRDLGSYAMVYILNGGGEFGDTLGHAQHVGVGDLIWLFPGVRHYYGPSHGGRWDEIYLVFDGPLIDLWREQKLISPDRPVWHLEPVSLWQERLQAIGLPPPLATMEDAFLHLSRFQSLVGDMILAGQEDASSPAERERIAQARRLLDTGKARSLQEVAREVGMSYESFRKKFAAQAGTSPAKYRQRRLIERACEFLMQRKRTQKEIALQLGFCDEFHFSKVFRRNMGVSPQAFRLKTLGVRHKRR